MQGGQIAVQGPRGVHGGRAPAEHTSVWTGRAAAQPLERDGVAGAGQLLVELERVDGELHLDLELRAHGEQRRPGRCVAGEAHP